MFPTAWLNTAGYAGVPCISIMTEQQSHHHGMRGRQLGAHGVVLVLFVVADQVLLHQQLLEYCVVDTGYGLGVSLQELSLRY